MHKFCLGLYFSFLKHIKIVRNYKHDIYGPQDCQTIKSLVNYSWGLRRFRRGPFYQTQLCFYVNMLYIQCVYVGHVYMLDVYVLTVYMLAWQTGHSQLRTLGLVDWIVQPTMNIRLSCLRVWHHDHDHDFCSCPQQAAGVFKVETRSRNNVLLGCEQTASVFPQNRVSWENRCEQAAGAPFLEDSKISVMIAIHVPKVITWFCIHSSFSVRITPYLIMW